MEQWAGAAGRGWFSHMRGKDPAVKLYELAHRQFEYERYDMAAEYARRALQTATDAELSQRLRALLDAAESADSRPVTEHGSASPSPSSHGSGPRASRQREAHRRVPARPMLDDADDPPDQAPDVIASSVRTPSRATRLPSPECSAVAARPVEAGLPPRSVASSAPAPASPRAGSCIHCGHPLADRSISVCPGCGQDPLLGTAMPDGVSRADDLAQKRGAQADQDSQRAQCCPQCGGALGQPLPRFCQNCGTRLTLADGGPQPLPTDTDGHAPPHPIRPRLFAGWVALVTAVLLITGYTGVIRATDARLQHAFPPSVRGANAPHNPPTRAVSSEAGAESTEPSHWVPERQVPSDKQIQTRTRRGWWKGATSWCTPTFKTGDLWAISWATAEARMPLATFDVSIHSADGKHWRPAVFALGADRGVEYCFVPGTFYLEIEADQPWEIIVWDLD